jgi:hypothetical protein
VDIGDNEHILIGKTGTRRLSRHASGGCNDWLLVRHDSGATFVASASNLIQPRWTGTMVNTFASPEASAGPADLTLEESQSEQQSDPGEPEEEEALGLGMDTLQDAFGDTDEFGDATQPAVTVPVGTQNTQPTDFVVDDENEEATAAAATTVVEVAEATVAPVEGVADTPAVETEIITEAATSDAAVATTTTAVAATGDGAAIAPTHSPETPPVAVPAATSVSPGAPPAIPPVADPAATSVSLQAPPATAIPKIGAAPTAPPKAPPKAPAQGHGRGKGAATSSGSASGNASGSATGTKRRVESSKAGATVKKLFTKEQKVD